MSWWMNWRMSWWMNRWMSWWMNRWMSGGGCFKAADRGAGGVGVVFEVVGGSGGGDVFGSVVEGEGGFEVPDFDGTIDSTRRDNVRSRGMPVQRRRLPCVRRDPPHTLIYQ